MWYGYNPQIIFLSYNLQLNVYHFSSIFCLQCYQILINVKIYVMSVMNVMNMSSNAPTVMKHLYVLMSWSEDMDML